MRQGTDVMGSGCVSGIGGGCSKGARTYSNASSITTRRLFIDFGSFYQSGGERRSQTFYIFVAMETRGVGKSRRIERGEEAVGGGERPGKAARRRRWEAIDGRGTA